MIIDAHQHFWQLTNPFCTWPTAAEAPIHRDFMPVDFEPLAKAHTISGTVLVQAAPDMAETKFLLGLADRSPLVRGVVGWVDMAARSAPLDVRHFAGHPCFRGIRPMLQSITDPLWMLNAHFEDVYRELIALDLSFDALVTPLHLEALCVLAARYPELRIIIDHGAKPQIAKGMKDPDGFAGWAPAMERFAGFENVSCKLSGLLTEAGPDASGRDMRPYLDHMLNVFGPHRLMWGSDWPVVNLAGDYARWVDICTAWSSDYSDETRRLIWGETAARLYRLTPAD